MRPCRRSRIVCSGRASPAGPIRCPKRMSDSRAVQVAVVDYGMGNLFSVKLACEQAGLQAVITNSKRDVLSAAAVILPGVGAFGTAMDALRELDLVEPLRDIAASRTPLVGICLGMQLLLSESHEL